ncbi:enolase-phosphatase E1 [Astrocystis sublimbata]|nr:enolase-phosphatase E1 [Astrocystis sublimbata]
MTAFEGFEVALLDIEGTVCPISFVKDVLFPFAQRALPETLVAKWDKPEFAAYRNAFPPEYRQSRGEFATHAQDLMDRDVKISYLKNLQGYLWEEGYAAGHLKAPLFPDVGSKLQAWHQNGVKIMIYSSGSVPAQKLLFGHTDAEPSDLSPLISDWFDTVNAGPKTEVDSYQTIAKSHPGIPIGRWLFLSDNSKEVEAALEAGMQSFIVRRPGNAELSQDAAARSHIIDSFSGLEGSPLIPRG